MRLEKLAQFDVNLLLSFALIAREDCISRAAKCLGRSRSTASRELQKAREMLQDELLLQTPSGLQPTSRGEKILDDLEEEAFPWSGTGCQEGAVQPENRAQPLPYRGDERGVRAACFFLCRSFVNKSHRVKIDCVPWPARAPICFRLPRKGCCRATRRPSNFTAKGGLRRVERERLWRTAHA